VPQHYAPCGALLGLFKLLNPPPPPPALPLLTIGSQDCGAPAPVHEESPPRRRETMIASSRRTVGPIHGREQGPKHGGRVERMEIIEITCPHHWV
jgi:hypothetical protein